MKARVAGSSGWPGERRTSWTIGGTSLSLSVAFPGRRREARRTVCLFLPHSLHSPPVIVWLPQAHLRCNNPLGTGVKEDLVSTTSCRCASMSFFQLGEAWFQKYIDPGVFVAGFLSIANSGVPPMSRERNSNRLSVDNAGNLSRLAINWSIISSDARLAPTPL